MCFSYSVNLQGKITPKDIGINPTGDAQQLGFFFNGFDHPNLPIVSKLGKIETAQWGLIPKWLKNHAGTIEFSNKTLNARIETIDSKPSFNDSWNNNPCLILASGFFEWQHRDNKKYPFYIYPQNNEILLFGGIFNDWFDNTQSRWIRTYSIITREANALMSEIHNTKKRMPLIIPHNLAKDWISENAKNRFEIANENSADYLVAHEVNPMLNSPKNKRNAAWSIEKYIPPQTTLF